MKSMNVYLNFQGNTEEVFNFYKSVFGGEFDALIRYKDMPMEGVNIPPKEEDKILHMSLPIGSGNILMATDSLDSMGQKVIFGNNSYIALNSDTKEEADTVFKGLSKGGKIEMAMADQPWGDYYGSLRDKYGVLWMISYTYPK